jgi:hypothetical protein
MSFARQKTIERRWLSLALESRPLDRPGRRCRDISNLPGQAMVCAIAGKTSSVSRRAVSELARIAGRVVLQTPDRPIGEKRRS